MPPQMTAPPVLVFDCGGEIAADERAFINFIVHIRNHDVALDEVIDHPLIVVAFSAFRGARGEHRFVQIGARGHERAGYRPAD